MRNEAIWLVQLLVSAALLGGVFGAGVWVGWHRWGRRPSTWESIGVDVEVRQAASGRPDLFAPEVDLRASAPVRGELTRGS